MLQEFEDLDEIIARFIQPLAANARDLLNHKYYKSTNGGKKDVIEDMLKIAKKSAPSRIPYIITVCKDLPGKGTLSLFVKELCCVAELYLSSNRLAVHIESHCQLY